MRTISIHQPWATLLLTGAKRHETRGWKTPYDPGLEGQWIGLHAAKRPLRYDEMTMPLLEICLKHIGQFWPGKLRYGHVIGKVFVDRVIDADQAFNTTTPTDRACGNFEAGRQAWHISKRDRCEAFAWRGQQKWFEVPDGLFRYVP